MRITIKDFGPIKNADIETKQFNIFIGETSTGKSVVAKLITIFNSRRFTRIPVGDYGSFQKLLAEYCIDFQFSDSTSIIIVQDNVQWKITKNSFLRDGIPSITLDLTKPKDIHGISDLNVFAEEFAKHITDDEKEDDFLKNARDSVINAFLDALSSGKVESVPTNQFQKDLMFYVISGWMSIQKTAPVYIPAERILISFFTNSIFNLLKSGSTIPQSIKNFGSLYEDARNSQKNLDIDFMKMKVKFSKENDTIVLKDGTELKFNQASSGVQSLIPLWAVLINSFSNSPKSVVIEEPELNLFPTLQVQLIRNIVELVNKSRSEIVITTHSPYVLSIIDSLIYANDVYKKAIASGKKNLKDKVLRLVKKATQIDYEKVATYCFNADGSVVPTNDPEMRSTGSFAIDEASNVTSKLFNKLMSIEYEL